MSTLFIKILNMSITTSYVIAAVLIIRLLFRKAPRKYSYLLWSVAAFRLCCPVSFSSIFSIFNIKLFDMTAMQSDGGAVLQYVPDNVGMMANPSISMGITAVNTVISGALPAATPISSVNPLQIWIIVGTVLWCIGMAALLIYGVMTFLKLQRRMCNAVLLNTNVYESEKVCSPFVLGIIKPKIYIPFGLDVDTRSYILTHERYHLKRRDHIIKPFAYLLLTIHWFNPLAWAAFILMSQDMEISCDEKVLGGKDNIEQAYSTLLLSFAANRRFPSASPLAFGETGVKKRIKNILRFQRPKLWITITAALMSIVVLMACAANPASEVPTEDAADPPVMNSNAEPEDNVTGTPRDALDAATDALYSLFDSGGSMDVGLWISGYGDYNTYTVDSRELVEQFVLLMSSHDWTETDSPNTSSSDFRVTISSADDSASFIYWQGSNMETVQYTDRGESTSWSVAPKNDDKILIAEAIRIEYDNLGMDSSRIAFDETGTAEDIVLTFVSEAYREHLMGLAPGSIYSVTDYKAVDWGVMEVSEDGKAIVGWFQYAVVPENYNSPGMWAGNTVDGTGEYAGWLIMSRQFVLQKQVDGYWHCIDFGTGGAKLPED